jgi:hypothetical protein
MAGVRWKTVVRLATELPEVEAATMYGSPAVGVRGSLIARLLDDKKSIVVKVGMDERDALCAAKPQTFQVTPEFRNYSMVVVRLAHRRAGRAGPVARGVVAADGAPQAGRRLRRREAPEVTAPSPTTPVYLEIGARRVFACAVDWPGWCRSGKTEELALQTLAAYTSRYAAVTQAAGVTFSIEEDHEFTVVERLPGTAATDFGVPGAVADGDARPLTGEEAARATALVQASWRVFDEVVAGAPAVLRKGPRGGGRDRARIVEHVLGAEVAYARKLGVRHRQPDPSDAQAVQALRQAIIGALGALSSMQPPEKGWPARYAARRVAWHVLDHAWEIEDRSDEEPGAGAR